MYQTFLVDLQCSLKNLQARRMMGLLPVEPFFPEHMMRPTPRQPDVSVSTPAPAAAQPGVFGDPRPIPTTASRWKLLTMKISN